MMVICIKQHLNNIWGSIHEKVKQYWGWVEKSIAYKKSVYIKRYPTIFAHILALFSQILPKSRRWLVCDLNLVKSSESVYHSNISIY